MLARVSGLEADKELTARVGCAVLQGKMSTPEAMRAAAGVVAAHANLFCSLKLTRMRNVGAARFREALPRVGRLLAAAGAARNPTAVID